MQYLKYALALGYLLAPLAAVADGAAVIDAPAPVAGTITVSELEKIQAETVLYEAQAARNKAWSDSQATGRTAPVLVTEQPAEEKTGEAIAQQAPPPRVLEIAGSGKQLRSRLLMADGSTVEARVGQHLPGTGYTVTGITARGVQLKTEDGRQIVPSFAE